jgi:hypothetical protein
VVDHLGQPTIARCVEPAVSQMNNAENKTLKAFSGSRPYMPPKHSKFIDNGLKYKLPALAEEMT